MHTELLYKIQYGTTRSLLKAVFGLLLGMYCLSGCNVAKRLPANERLYMGTDFKINADSTVSGDEVSTIEDQLATLARPKPNAQLFGFPYKVALYYWIGEPKKENGFRAWFRRKLGAPPVFASSKALGSNSTIFAATLENQGYFGSTASGTLQEEGYKARALYQVNVAPRYYIDSVGFLVDSTPVRKALRASSNRTVIKKGQPYNFDNIKLERERISQALKQRGYYYFQPDFIAVLADNDTARHQTDVYFAVKPEIPEAAQQPYYIRNVYIYPNYSLSTLRADTNRAEAYQTNERFNVVDSSRNYDPRLFRSVVAVRPGRLYNSRAQDLTLSRFINLGTFKFVRNRFAPVQQGDTSMLDVHYYLTPAPEKSIRLELAATSRSNNFNGTGLTGTWQHRNFFKRAEQLTINANAGIEFQVNSGGRGLTNYRYGADAILSFPRLVNPLIRFRYDRRQILPKTNLTLGYEKVIRGNLYNLSSFRTSFGYAWRQNQQVEHSFSPFNVTYTRPSNISLAFIDSAINNSLVFSQLVNIRRSEQLILSTLYTFNFNSPVRTNRPTTFRLTTNAEISGNVANLLFNRRNEEGDKVIFDVPFAQYARLDADARVYRRLGSNLTWANRIFAGLGITYGNSEALPLPLVRQYFVGGSNSIRAFRPRAIGPGLYTRDTIRNIPLYQDGGGDIRLEANTELRLKLNQYIELATFVDAGNVWSYSDIGTFGPEAKFPGWNFADQLAVGTGVGLRIDLSYFLLRFDLATPLRKPYEVDGSKWVIDQINFRDRNWRQENLVFNIGVGYPF